MAQVEWFGRDWAAPICKDTSQIPVPVGVACVFCGADLNTGDQGIMMDYHVSVEAAPDRRPAHLQCLLHAVSGYRKDRQ